MGPDIDNNNPNCDTDSTDNDDDDFCSNHDCDETNSYCNDDCADNNINGAPDCNECVDSPETLAKYNTYNAVASSNRDFKIDINDNYVFLYIPEKGLSIIDFSEPDNPINVSNYNDQYFFGYGGYVHVKGKNVYLLSGYNELMILDINDIANPVQTALWISSDSSYLTNVKTYDNYAVISYSNTDNTGGGIRILDVTDKTNPFEISHLEEIETNDVYDNNIDIKKDQNNTYIYYVSERGLFITIDVSDPQLPTVVNRIESNAGTKIIVNDNYAYLYEMYGMNIYLYDISNPSQPQMIEDYEFEHWITSIDVNLNYLYIVGDLDFANDVKIEIYDMMDKSNPIKIASFYPPDANMMDIGDIFMDKIIAKDFWFYLIGTYEYTNGTIDFTDDTEEGFLSIISLLCNDLIY